MKKFLLLVVLAIVATAGTEAKSGELEVGAKMNIYSRWNGIVGFGPLVKYDINKMMRVESAFLFLTKKGASIDWSNELQFPFQLSSAMEVYPLVGVSLNDPYKFGVALGLGGGVNYNLNDRWGVNAGVKWNLQSQKYIKNPLIFSFGASLKL